MNLYHDQTAVIQDLENTEKTLDAVAGLVRNILHFFRLFTIVSVPELSLLPQVEKPGCRLERSDHYHHAQKIRGTSHFFFHFFHAS